ncbi:unnamed protein product [Discula destructiva]
MNTSPASVAGILERVTLGVSRTSIRHYAAPPRRFKKKKHHLTGFKRGHGERIFVYNHIENGMIIYSHEPELKRDCNKALAQIPFTVKKQKPAVLRRDYWQPLCMIQFDVGRAVVGRNVFQKLREFRQLHELQWGWQAAELRKMAKQDRGAAIHNQKPNAVADIAAALAGSGRGNLMWTTEPLEQNIVEETPVEEVKMEKQVAEEEKKNMKKTATPATGPRRLLNATIYWANDVDLDWARKWSDNVTHEVGLPTGVEVVGWKTKMIREDPTQDTVAGEMKKATNDKAGKSGTRSQPEPAPAQQKTWLDSLVGRFSRSSSEARV